MAFQIVRTDEVPDFAPAPATGAPKFQIVPTDEVPDFGDLPADGPGAVSRGFVSSVIQDNPGAFADAMEGVSHLVGDHEWSASLRDAAGRLRDAARAPEKYQPQSGGVSDLWDAPLSKGLTYLGERFGQAVGSTLPSLAAGTIGAVAGGRVAGRPGAVVGGLGGAAVPSAGMNYGGMYRALVDEGVRPEVAAEWAGYAAGPITALDAAPVGGWAQRLAGQGARQQVQRALAKRMMEEAAKGAAAESATEGAQQLIQEGVASWITGKDFWTPERMANILDSAVAGGMAGGAFGGVSGVPADRVDGAPAPGAEPPPVQVNPLPLPAPDAPLALPGRTQAALPPPDATYGPGFTARDPRPGEGYTPPPTGLPAPPEPVLLENAGTPLLPAPDRTYGPGFTVIQTDEVPDFGEARHEFRSPPPQLDVSPFQIVQTDEVPDFGDGPPRRGRDVSFDDVVRSIHQQESGGKRTSATSTDGARGGMQIMPATFRQYARPGENIDNPADNMAVGRRIIADLYEKAGGDPARVAVGYFSGPGNIAPPSSPTPWKSDRADGNGKSVSSYVNDVMKRLGRGGLPSDPQDDRGAMTSPEPQPIDTAPVELPELEAAMLMPQPTEMQNVAAPLPEDDAVAPIAGAISAAPPSAPIDLPRNTAREHRGRTASWVVTEKATGKPVLETFDPDVARKVNTEKYAVAPVGDYLAGLNKPPAEPANPPPRTAVRVKLQDGSYAGNGAVGTVIGYVDGKRPRVKLEGFGGFKAPFADLVTVEPVEKPGPDDIASQPDLGGVNAAPQPEAGAASEAEAQQASLPPMDKQAVDIAITPRGRKVPVRYEVVDASSLIPAPEDLQPRDRSRAASQQQIARMAQALEPSLLGKSPSATDGAPIVGPDGVVESGNWRVAAIRRAYHDHPESAARYREWLAGQGYDTAGMAAPVLIRRRSGDLSPEDRRAFVREANERTTLGMSATEQALSDASAVPADVFSMWRGGEVSAAGNRPFVREFVKASVPQSEQASFIAADGQIGQDGVRRIQGALLGRAYGDAALISNIMESTDSNIRAIGGALLDVSGDWAAMRAEAASGAINRASDITSDVVAAANVVRRARDEGRDILEFVGQGEMFGGGGVSPITEGVLRIFYRGERLDRARGREKIAGALRHYAEEAMKSLPGRDMLGAEPVAPSQILDMSRAKIERVESNRAGQSELLPGSQSLGKRAPSGGGGGQRPGGRGGSRKTSGSGGQVDPKRASLFGRKSAPRPPRVAWPADFPDVVTHATVSARDGHPDYAAAKSGDVLAAARLAKDLVTPDATERVRAAMGGRRPSLVPVRAVEASGINKIPDATAAVLAHSLRLSVAEGIVQTNVVEHTRSSAAVRFARQPAFTGTIDAGAEYFIVDDHVGMGGTIANLRGYIESRGGLVIGATTLTASRNSATISLRPETLGALRLKHGGLESWWIDRFGHGYDALTEPEAQHLIRIPDSESIRDRIASAVPERGSENSERPVGEVKSADSLFGDFRSPRDRERIAKRIAEIVHQIAPQTNVEVVNDLMVRVGGRDLPGGGQYDPARNLVTVALNFGDPEITAGHEAIHALRGAGLFTDQEWSVLSKAANERWIDELGVRDLYKNVSDEIVVEEAIAQKFAEWRMQPTKELPSVRRAFTKLLDFFRRLANALRGMGFRTAEDVFEAAERGDVGRRGASEMRPDMGGAAPKPSRFASEPDAINAAHDLSYRENRGAWVWKDESGEYHADVAFKPKAGEFVARVFGDEVFPVDEGDIARASLWNTTKTKAAPAMKQSPQKPGTDAQRAAIARTIGNSYTPLRERVREAIRYYTDRQFLRVKQGLLDQFASIKALERDTRGSVAPGSRSPYKSVRLTRNLHSVMAYVLRHGPIAVSEQSDGGVWFGPMKNWDKGGFEDIFGKIAEDGLLDLWKGWAVAVRADRLMREGRENLMTRAEIDALLPLGQQHPEFRVAHRKWQAFNRAMLDMAEASGLVNQEQRSLWENADYIPFFRLLDDDVRGSGNGGAGVANQRSGIRTLKGGDAKLNDPIENMVMNMTSLVDRSFKNLAARKAIALALEAGVVSREKYDWRKSKVAPEDAARALEDIGVQVRGLTKQQHQQMLEFWQMQAPTDPDVVSVMVNGKPQFFRVHDAALLRSLSSLTPTQLNGVLAIFRWSKGLLTKAITADPAFMIANTIRDTMASYVLTGVNGMAALRKALSETDPTKLSVMASGGGLSGFYGTDPAEARKSIHDRAKQIDRETVLDTPRKLWEAWRRVGQATESLNRIAIADATKKAGGSEAEAAFQAMDLLDFGMRGDSEAVRFIIDTVPFLNARLQGLYRLGRGIKESPKAFLIRGALVTAASLTLLALNWDNPEYEALEDWDKDTYWHFWIDGQHFRIPKPFEVGVLFATVPERVTRSYFARDDMKKSWESTKRALLDTFAMNPTPQLLAPLVEQFANRDFFTDRPIVGRDLEQLPAEMQAKPQTSETAQEAGKMTGISPVRIEHIVNGYFGTMGSYLLALTDQGVERAAGYPAEPTMRIDDIPVVKRFAREHPARTTRFVTEFYDMLDDVRETTSALREFQKRGDASGAKSLASEKTADIATSKQMEKVADTLAALRRSEVAIMRDQGMTPSDKRRRLDEITTQRNALAENAVKMQATIRVMTGISQTRQ